MCNKLQEVKYVKSVEAVRTIEAMPLNTELLFRERQIPSQRVHNAVTHLRKKGYVISYKTRGVEGCIVNVLKAPKK